MPKKTLLIVLIMSLTLLVACSSNHANNINYNDGNDNENINDVNNDDRNNVNNDVEDNGNELEKKDFDSEAEEIFSKMIEAAKPINSYANYVEENETIGNDEQSWSASLKKERYMITDEPAFREKMIVLIPSLIAEQEDVETYLTEEGFFQYGNESEQWYKYDDSVADQVRQDIKTRSNLQAIVEDWSAVINSFDMDEDEDFYYFSLLFDDEAMEEGGERLSEIFDVEAMEEMNVYKLFHEVKVDKSTYLISSMVDVKAFTIDTENDTLEVEKEVITEFGLFNEVRDIELPKEALEEAEEVDM